MDGRHLAQRVRMERFMNGGLWKCIAIGRPEDCWPWIGTRHRQGYGVFRIQKRIVFAHRRIMELALGRPLTTAECVLHHCDNPPCCNPSHLFVGTHADNMADKARKGRAPSKLTPEQVRVIRLSEGITQRDLAATYGVTHSTISLIRSRRNWRHLGD